MEPGRLSTSSRLPQGVCYACYAFAVIDVYRAPARETWIQWRNVTRVTSPIPIRLWPLIFGVFDGPNLDAAMPATAIGEGPYAYSLHVTFSTNTSPSVQLT
jgi:hypothetical protein